MTFDLTNSSAMFQHLMEIWLGDLQLNWCIIYVNDIFIFSATPVEHLKCLERINSLSGL